MAFWIWLKRKGIATNLHRAHAKHAADAAVQGRAAIFG